MKKIEIYLLKQIIKSFFLIFFIFIGISWLLQTTRLLNLIVINKIPIFKVFLLSIYIIPNTIVTIAPFIVFISILLTCLKLNKDKEIIAAYTLGINSKNIIKPFYIFSFLILISILALSFYISPYAYGSYKENEFNLRTSLDIKNIGLNNFFEFNNEIIINFEKKDNDFINLFIYQKNPKENLIIANRTRMELEDNNLYLKLYDGFKAELKKESNEILVFDKYNFQLNLDNKQEYNNTDTNTYGFNKLVNDKNYLLINQRLIDALLLVTLIYFIINNLLIKLKFSTLNLVSIIVLSISFIFFDNILANLKMNDQILLSIMYINCLMPIFINVKFNLK